MMGQYLAHKHIEEGIALYNQDRQTAAVEKWQNAFYKLQDQHLQFRILTYMTRAYSELGSHVDMLACAYKQLHIGKISNDNRMLSESYLSLARSYGYLCSFDDVLSHCKQALVCTQDSESVLVGYILLCRVDAYVGKSNFKMAVKDYHTVESIAKNSGDKSLLLKVYLSLGNLYLLLLDYRQALGYFRHVMKLSKSFFVCDVGQKLQKLTLCSLAETYVRLGRLAEATQCCQVYIIKDVSLQTLFIPSLNYNIYIYVCVCIGVCVCVFVCVCRCE